MQSSTPRGRRLINDFELLSGLVRDTSAISFEVSARGESGIPESYIVTIQGPSLERIDTLFEYAIRVRESHQFLISFGPQYPRLMPQIQWMTPIFHPNISLGGSVCLGGYSTHWVPSLRLDQLCEMLWDMICFRNYNLESPFNRDAAIWMQQQRTFQFPLEARPLRRMGRSTDSFGSEEWTSASTRLSGSTCLTQRPHAANFDPRQKSEIVFLDPQ